MAQSYAERIARGTARYLSEHPGATAEEAHRAARGHGATGEHGVTVTAAGPDIVITFHDPAKLPQALRAAERYGGRASVTVTGKNGKSATLFSNPGHLPGRTLDSIKSLTGGSKAKDAFFNGLQGTGGGGGGRGHGSDDDLGTAIPDGASGVDEYQLIVH